MEKRPTANGSGQHRLVPAQDLDRFPVGAALWQGGDPAACPATERMITALRRAIRTRLTALQREAVELHYFEGLSQGQIAVRLGVSQQVISKRLHGDVRKGRAVGGALPRLRVALAPLLKSAGSIRSRVRVHLIPPERQTESALKRHHEA